MPEGPVPFLREWGVSLQSPLPRKSEDHKRELVEGMLTRYLERDQDGGGTRQDPDHQFPPASAGGSSVGYVIPSCSRYVSKRVSS